MADPPSPEDEALFARLNTIRPTNFSFDNTKPLLPPLHSESEDTPEDLISRFQQVHGRRPTQQDASVPVEDSTKEDRPASPTIEELLAEIGSEEQFKVDEIEIKETRSLLAEAKAALPPENLQGSDEPQRESRVFPEGLN